MKSVFSLVSVTIALVLAGNGCGGPKQPPEEQTLPARVPMILLLEKEIKGHQLNGSLKSPAGLAIGRYGAVYVVDRGNDRVILFDSDFTPRKAVGGHGSQPGLLDGPQFISIDVNRNVWVSDQGNRRLVLFSQQLEFIDEIDLQDDEDLLRFGHPAGVAMAAFGDLWVADTDNDRIAVLDNFGAIDRMVGDFGYPGGQLDSPSKILIDANGNFLVCDTGNRRVVVYDEQGGFVREIAPAGLGSLRSFAKDERNQLWVLEDKSGRIHCLAPDGQVLSTLGPMVAGASRALTRPFDFAFTTDGRMVISDTGNDRLLVCRILYENEPE